MGKQICTRCIYDETIPLITFDSAGVCNYCHQYDRMQIEYPTGEKGRDILDKMVEQMKREGRNKVYDIVIGVSGGCDSSYMLHLAKKEFGLRPLAVHFDNTWNSKTAVENIYNMISKLDIPLYTHVVDNQEFNDIFKSFLKASVPEIDTSSDIALATTHYMAAVKHGVKYIWEGHSFRTEGISPMGWFYMDAKYIETIQKRFGTIPIKTLPNLWLGKWLKWITINRIKKIRPLYYMDYDKENAKKFMSETYGWQWYGGHHMENGTAYFTNNYFLPKKFGIDLRYCEFSALIRSGQMSRQEGIEKINQPKEFDMDLLVEVKKRMDFSDEEFEVIMALPKKTYKDYRTYKRTFERMRPFFWLMYRMNLVSKSFYVKFTAKDKRA